MWVSLSEEYKEARLGVLKHARDRRRGAKLLLPKTGVKNWRSKDWVKFMEDHFPKKFRESDVLERVMGEVVFRLTPVFAMMHIGLGRFMCTEMPETLRPNGEIFEQVFLIAVHRHLLPEMRRMNFRAIGDYKAAAEEEEKIDVGMRFDS